VREEIQSVLGLSHDPVWAASVARPGLAVRVEEVVGEDEKLRAIVAARHIRPGTALVYASLVKTVERFAEQLHRLGLDPLVYHGQMTDQARRANQRRWLDEPNRLMVATPAFGLGIDKPDVRLVVHVEPPGSIEAWAQEMGRGGRDGQGADIWMLYDRDDLSIQREFIRWSNPEPGFISAVGAWIRDNLPRARQEGMDGLRRQMNFANRRDFRVETAVNLLKSWGCLTGERSSEWNWSHDPEAELLDEPKWRRRMESQTRALARLEAALDHRPGGQMTCRMVETAAYFGEALAPCGLCDLCVAKPSA
jgi:ATP-dependent DNA helicase RecQ